MNVPKWPALVVTLWLCAAGIAAEAEPDVSPEPDAPSETRRAVESHLRHLDGLYGLTDEQKTQLKQMLHRHHHASQQWSPTNEPRIDAIRQKIDKLNGQLKQLASGLNELKARQAADIQTVVTAPQRIAAQVKNLRRRTIGPIWNRLSEPEQIRVIKLLTDVAGKIEAIAPADRRAAERAALADLGGHLQQIITPEMRHDFAVMDLSRRIITSFRRVELTESQITTIRALCGKSLDERTDAKEQLDRLEKDIQIQAEADMAAALAKQARAKNKLSEMRAKIDWRHASEALTKSVVATVLTAEQRKRLEGLRPPTTATKTVAAE